MTGSLDGNVSAIKVSPYTTDSSTIFVGTESGSVFKVTMLTRRMPTIIQLQIGQISQVVNF